ncbi:hypothetical protein BDP81DRAFT_362582 [Colletotrichum phormii]|uniref:Uncharacterized protein n=1 Tax=Colletotrichum phormii TaxID=359342 RepID=A0AAI9ZBF2_9PEZI|nr:uncharacterized protein BDP81DRAFT_362582 [Colletotrichum phormii]KAK1621428.1 hypothetical protein BDP81DRAFT_362582 [Colletotrichum phormii]
MYANTEDDFDAAWDRLLEEFADQDLALKYITDTYLPLRYQWANCFISQCENFGVRTNSPTETAHKDLKSYVINGNSDLYAVAQAIEEMLRNKARTYRERVAAMESRTRYEYLRRDWLETVSKEVGLKALKTLPLSPLCVGAQRTRTSPTTAPCRPLPPQGQPPPQQHQAGQRRGHLDNLAELRTQRRDQLGRAYAVIGQRSSTTTRTSWPRRARSRP